MRQLCRLHLALRSLLKEPQRGTGKRCRAKGLMFDVDQEVLRTGLFPAVHLIEGAHLAGRNPGAPLPSAWDLLSPQESQIAGLVIEGLGNKEIGRRLYLSHRTVGSHLYRIFPKLGVSSRAQLIRALSDAGSVEPTTGTGPRDAP